METTTPRSFISPRHDGDAMAELDETYAHHPTPAGFKTELLPHQKTILAAALALEDTRGIVMECAAGHMRKVSTNMGMISEKFGAGKTPVALSLLVEKPMPENRPIYQACRHINGVTRRTGNKGPPNTSFFITKKFADCNVLKPALIFVASSVVLQWCKAIRDFTDLRVMPVTGVYELRTLYNRIKDGTVNEYDIILVKNGVITGEFKIDGYVEDKNKAVSRKIFNIIANITRKKCWSRLILDDYDIIKLPRPTAFMNALFTWFISATHCKVNTTIREPNEHSDMHSVLTYHNLDLLSMSKSFYMTKVFNIRNKPSYTESSISLGKPVFWTHTLVNKNRRYINMIGEMEGDRASEIMEMLNGDAIGTAAEHAGIKSDNIADIFQKILQDKYASFTLANSTLRWISTLDIDGFEHMGPPIGDDVYHQKDVYKQRPIEFKYPDIKGKVENVYDACTLCKKESGVAIERVKDNIKEGDCPVCCGDLNDDDAIIVRCCGKILCADCAKTSTGMTRRGTAIEGRCPNCRARIAFTDLIFINSEFNLDDILIEQEEKCEDVPIDAVEPVVDDTKFDILRKIITGEELPKKTRREDIVIDGMLSGIKELPEAPSEHRKVIIFSKFTESLISMGDQLTEAGISYKRLGGTASNLHDVATEFQDSYGGVNVLLINGEKYASGLNLQSATDLVFMHKIMDRSVEAQIIGRIQRLGRAYKAHIHYVLYDEELRYMNFT